jgi:phosphoribosylanthranilate isomerase
MFRIKICGLSDLADVPIVVGAGADAVGLNFYPPSPRYVEPSLAAKLSRAVAEISESVCRVGLFVNSPLEQIAAVVDQVELNAIQLHGDETPEMLAAIKRETGLPIIRAFRLSGDSVAPVAEYLDHCRTLSALPEMVLLDAFKVGEYGGTGRTADWGLAAQYNQLSNVPPLVLAGGLTPENVSAAISAVGPFGVDTAGGVESSPGRKDPDLCNAFVAAARAAFEGAV